ncbi:MAG: cob(I)yrinic acid a,c-diamide adenosyltransferase [Bdellovibrionales bacterium]|nr:cob(I)yrinic acid a,c-diamide adenosyltransferase [Bdellovibrionales bacterium]
MKIYTKRGDAGQTDLLAGLRVSKTHPRIEAYGTIDELNSVLGLAAAEPALPAAARAQVERIQSELFQLGTELATPPGKPLMVLALSEEAIMRLENEIDAMEAELEPLKSFILPGGSRESALFHLARTVCRRGERAMVALDQQASEPGGDGGRVRGEAMRYLNRLSDHLFVLARWVNRKSGAEDVPWHAPRVR